jgi:hypothetical protein
MKTCTETSHRSRRRIFALFAIGVFAIAGILCLVRLAPTRIKAPPPNQRLRTELDLRDGCLFDRGNPFTGAVLEYYANGQIKSRSSISNGLLEGLSEGWHTNGVLQVSEHFAKGVSNGLRTKYYENGKKLSETRVINGTIEGLYQRWHENGILAQRFYLTNGLPNGEAVSYFPDGALKARVRLDHGTVVEQRFAKQGDPR